MSNKLTHAQKIKQSKINFANVQHQLQEQGITSNIKRVGKKNYNVIINFEIVKNYKQRRGAKNYIKRLLIN